MSTDSFSGSAVQTPAAPAPGASGPLTDGFQHTPDLMTPGTTATDAPPISRTAVMAEIVGRDDAEGGFALDEATDVAAPATEPAPAEYDIPTDDSETTEAAAPEAAVPPTDEPTTEAGPLKPGKFAVRAADGTFVEVPSVKVDFTVGDKTYSKSIPDLIRMAQDGVTDRRASYAAEQTAQREAAARQELATQMEQVRAEAEEAREFARQLLDDEEAYYARRTEWQQINSPEARAERAERELRATRERVQIEGRQQEMAVFYKTNIEPALLAAVAAAPSLSQAELTGKLMLDTAGLMVNGTIPPEHFPRIAEYLRTDFAQWARSEEARRGAASREAEQREAAARKAAEAEAARRVQAAKRQATLAAAPTAGRAAVGDTRPPVPNNRNAIKQSIITDFDE